MLLVSRSWLPQPERIRPFSSTIESGEEPMALSGLGNTFGSSFANTLAAQGTQNTAQADANAERSTTVRAEGLTKDSFLQLLIAQLQHQDPTNPMDNMQFSEQLAQFASLEQLQNLNSNFSEMQKAQQIAQVQGLVGQEVSYSTTVGDQEVRQTGTVDAVRIMDDGVFALINGGEVRLANIDTIIRAGFQMTKEAEPQGADRETEKSNNSAATGGSKTSGSQSSVL
jgi:flagellar hook assembly protein FlgD